MSNMNRIWNSTNRFQTPMKRVLAVCSAGLLRSPTTANVLHREFGYNTRSAGSEPSFALIPVDEVLLQWADEVVFVNADNYKAVKTNEEFNAILNTKTVVVLNVPDRYAWNEPELQAAILDQYREASPVSADS